VTNAEFSRALGTALHRPAIVPMPAFALRLLVGELADSILTGQRAVPARAEEMGYQFRFRTLGAALKDLLG
jgi:NAD dependent epimerase/dehydratase family enzyme